MKTDADCNEWNVTTANSNDKVSKCQGHILERIAEGLSKYLFKIVKKIVCISL